MIRVAQIVFAVAAVTTSIPGFADTWGRSFPKSLVCDGQESVLAKDEFDNDFLSSKSYPKQDGRHVHMVISGDTQGITLELTLNNLPPLSASSPASFQWGCDARCSIRFEPNKLFGLYLINWETGLNSEAHQSVYDAVQGKSDVPLRARLYLNLSSQPEEGGSGILKSSPRHEGENTLFVLACKGDFIKGTSENPHQ